MGILSALFETLAKETFTTRAKTNVLLPPIMEPEMTKRKSLVVGVVVQTHMQMRASPIAMILHHVIRRNER